MGNIITFTGRKFFPLAPQVADVDVRDIAHALSMQCRFAGHSNRFYSVAEHCVMVSLLVPEIDALAGLLHDATEAYMSDIVNPLKIQEVMRPYREAEDRLQAVIFRAFGLPPEMPQSVHVADKRICASEAQHLFNPVPEWVWERKPYEGFLPRCWSPGEARAAYLKRFHELVNQEIKKGVA